MSIPYVHMGEDEKTGCDCYGFVKLFYKDWFNLELEHPIISKEGKGIERRNNCLRPFFEPLVKVEIPQFGDIVLYLNHMGLPLHVGVYIGDSKVLNMSSDIGCNVVKYMDNYSKTQVAGLYRHEQVSDILFPPLP